MINSQRLVRTVEECKKFGSHSGNKGGILVTMVPPTGERHTMNSEIQSTEESRNDAKEHTIPILYIDWTTIHTIMNRLLNEENTGRTDDRTAAIGASAFGSMWVGT